MKTMAEPKRKKKAEEPAPMAPAPPAQPPPAQPPRAVVVTVEYTWPRKSRCPRCGVTDTERVSDDGPTQYRKCVRPVCRFRFKVHGTVL
jgi:phage FluMu protein Com